MTHSLRLTTLLARPIDADAMRQFGCRRTEPVSWLEFSEQARCWQVAFQRSTGQRFALFFSDGIAFAAALFGLWQAGKQAWLPADLACATQAVLRERVAGWAGDGAGIEGLPQVQPHEEAAPFATTPLDLEAEGLVVFTSGSTGAPEACTKRLRQLFHEIGALEQAFGAASAGCTVVASVSAQHVYGLLFRVLWPIATGRLVQACSLVYWEDLPDLAPSDQRVALISSPTHLGRLPLAGIEAAARVDQMFSSGAPLPDNAVSAALRIFGRAPIEVYGSTETGGVAWRQRVPGNPASWSVLPGVQWRLDAGQLVVRSPHLPTTDWTACADRAAAAGDGFELRGRADRIVKIAEKRVSLLAIEHRLLRGGLLAALNLVMLDEARAQLGVVAVPTTEGWALHDSRGRRALAEALREQLLDVVDRVALPRRWRFLPELPCNALGKSTQTRLQAEFDRRRPAVRELVRDGGKVELTLLVDAALPQFDGHFRGHPVLPGVAQLDWAMLFGRELFHVPDEFNGIEALKFQRVVVPGTRLVLELDWQASTCSKSPCLSFRYASASGPHASGRLLFGDAT